MACKYWYDGNWRTEQEFKSILENGLLDQLLRDNIVSLKEFELDESKIKNVPKETVSKKPIELRIRRKIQRNLNLSQDPNTLEPTKNNPVTLLKKAAKKRKDNDNKLMLIVKTEGVMSTGQGDGDTVYATIHTGYEGELSKKVKKYVEESKVDFAATMKPGYVYMLVPSAYGMYPVRVFTHKITDTTDSDVLKK